MFSCDLPFLLPPQVKDTYCRFLYHCYIDTEVDNKETFTRDYLWDLFKCFVMDIGVVRTHVQVIDIETTLGECSPSALIRGGGGGGGSSKTSNYRNS